MPSPFWAFQGQRTVTPSMMTSRQRVGTRWKRGAFWIVTPVTVTRSQSVRRIIWARSFSSLFSPAVTFGKCFRLKGYQSEPSWVTLPPLRRYCFHSSSLFFERFTGRHHSPFPSMIPSPEIRTSWRLDALMNGRPLPSSTYALLSGVKTMTADFSR